MTVYRCSVCDTEYDEEKEDVTWDQVSDDWACHVCETGKSLFRPVVDGRSGSGSTAAVTGPAAGQPEAFEKTFDEYWQFVIWSNTLGVNHADQQ